MSRVRLPAAAVLLSIALFVTACGGKSKSSAEQSTTQTQTQATQPTPTTTPVQPKATKARKVKPTVGEADIGTKPKVPKGRGNAPTQLDLKKIRKVGG